MNAPAEEIRGRGGPDRPDFTHACQVYFDELDPFGLLHNARYVVHVERAGLAWYLATMGRTRLTEDDPDRTVVVRAMEIEYLTPIRGPILFWVDVWAIRLGRTSITYGFRCRDEAGSVTYAQGQRTLLKVDPATGRPAPWSDSYRQRAREAMAQSPRP